jgi:cyclopropane fatty-acyl-phospholipid synthase-like methyltransferase
MRLIRKCNLKKNASILNVGAGATTLVDALLDEGYEGVIASDLTACALERLKERLGKNSSRVDWIVDDLTHPEKLNGLAKVDLWHDRAVLHFFQMKKEQQTYFDLVRNLLKKGGYVIIAAFNLQGAEKCFGLPVHRYDEAMLQERLGEEFELKEAFNFNYMAPSGDSREYVYTLFQRLS